MSNNKNTSFSYVKSLYFLEPLKNLTTTNETVQAKNFTHKSLSLLKPSRISSAIKKQTIEATKKNKVAFMHIPIHLPLIIKDKNIKDSKNTISFFDERSLSPRSGSSTKKKYFPLLKEDNYKTIKNAKNLNEILYKQRNKSKENTSKMLIKELWNKSYHNNVLKLSGIKSKQEKIESKRIEPFTKRLEELENHFNYNKDSSYFGFLNSDENSRKNSSLSRKYKNKKELKSGVNDLLEKCRLFNSEMKNEKRLIYFI